MRPARAPLHRPATPVRNSNEETNLRAVATGSFTPRGPAYDPVLRLRRRAVALRGGEDALVVAFAWVHGAVRVRVLARGGCTSEDVESAFDAARGLLALDDDPTEFFRMVRGHDVLEPLARRVDPRIAMTPTVFETCAVAIIEQLVTGYEARAAARRLWRIAGEPVPGTELVAAPQANAVRRVPMWKLHEIGIGSRRAATLRDVAGRGAALERLRSHAPEVAMEKVQSIAGVGPWTANYIARDGLGWADAVPVGDFHAPFTITAALGGPQLGRDEKEAADEALVAVLEPFRPHRARVALLIERYTEPGGRRWRRPKVDPHRREPWRY